MGERRGKIFWLLWRACMLYESLRENRNQRARSRESVEPEGCNSVRNQKKRRCHLLPCRARARIEAAVREQSFRRFGDRAAFMERWGCTGQLPCRRRRLTFHRAREIGMHGLTFHVGAGGSPSIERERGSRPPSASRNEREGVGDARFHLP
jgi:hypothetical protein